jgi:hypothetical protein
VSPASAVAAAPARFYVDTSAYLCILLGEDGWEDLSAALAGGEMVSSVLIVLEASRNLIRLAREGTLTADQFEACAERLRQDRSAFVLRDLTLDLCESAVMPPVTTPRSLDLAHLRTALWFHTAQSLTRFVTVDAGQKQAARALGLPV